MATIGTFIAVENGYEGTLETLTIKAQVVLEKRQKTKDKQPDYDMFADGREIGAAWERMGFLSLNIDDPSFPRQLHPQEDGCRESLHADLPAPSRSQI